MYLKKLEHIYLWISKKELSKPWFSGILPHAGWGKTNLTNLKWWKRNLDTIWGFCLFVCYFISINLVPHFKVFTEGIKDLLFECHYSDAPEAGWVRLLQMFLDCCENGFEGFFGIKATSSWGKQDYCLRLNTSHGCPFPPHRNKYAFVKHYYDIYKDDN